MYVDAAPAFKELGCVLSVVATADKLGEYAPYFKNAGYNVFHMPFPNKNGMWSKIVYYRQMKAFLKTENFDVIHIHSNGMMFVMSFIAWLVGIKSVYTFHNVFATHFYSYPWHFFKRWCAAQIFGCTFQTISQSVYNNERHVYFNPTTLVYNWYGNKRFYPADKEEKNQARKALEISDTTLVLISIGGCSHIKRHSDIIKALPKVADKFPDLLYLHLGKGCTEKDESNLAHDLSVDKYIRFCGNISDVRNYLIASDIYLMPSKFEGIPITTIEAMGCKIPSILYDVPGLRDFNKEGNNALLIEADYKLLADSILTLSIDKSLALQLTENAKSFVDKTFSLKQNTKKIFDLYKL